MSGSGFVAIGRVYAKLLKQHNLRAKLSAFLAGEKTDAKRLAFIGPARRTGVEQMNIIMHLVGRSMGVTEKKPVA